MELKLLNDGSIDVDRKLKIPEGIPTRYDNTFFIIPFHLLAGQTIKVNGKPLHIKENYAEEKNNCLILKHSKDVKRIELFPDKADKRIVITSLKAGELFCVSPKAVGETVYSRVEALQGGCQVYN